MKIGLALAGWLFTACGSSSAGALFGNSGENPCNSNCGGSAGGNPVGEGGAASGGGGSAAGGVSGASGAVGAGGSVGAGGAHDSGGDVGAGGQEAAGGAGGRDTGTGGAPPASCPVGEYHAVLEGPYRSLGGTNDVNATIDFAVAESGATTGSFAGPGGAKATVTGSVDCATRMLTAKIENGAYLLGPLQTKFSGTFDGNYDASVSGFDGTWSIKENGSDTNGGIGTWSTH